MAAERKVAGTTAVPRFAAAAAIDPGPVDALALLGQVEEVGGAHSKVLRRSTFCKGHKQSQKQLRPSQARRKTSPHLVRELRKHVVHSISTGMIGSSVVVVFVALFVSLL